MAVRRHLEPLLASLGALLLGSALAVGVAWRDLSRLGRAVMGFGNNDAYGSIYLHHSFHRALREGRWGLEDPMQLWPAGYDRIPNDGGNSLEFLLSFLFQIFLDFPTWYNAAALAWIPLNLQAFLPLGRHLWGRWGPALAAGAAWALMPPILGQLTAGRLTQVVLIGVPLAVLGLLKLSEEGGRRAVVLAGAGMALTGLGYWFYGYFLAILAPLLLLPGLWKRPRRDFLIELAQAAGLCLLLVAPLLLLVLSSRAGGYAPGSAAFHDPVSPDAVAIWGGNARHMKGWLPWVLLPGFALTAWKGQRRLLWAGLALATVICAMGAAQVSPAGWTWKLPYWLLWKLAPGLDRMTHPDRWIHVGGLFLAVLAADGLARWKPWATWILPLGVFVQVQLVNLPFGGWRAAPEGVYAQLAEEPGGALVILPFLQCSNASRAHPFHGRATVGGMVEELPEKLPAEFTDFVTQSQLLMNLHGLSQGERVELQLWQEDLDRLHAAGVDTLVLDRHCQERSGTARDAPIQEELTELLGSPSFEADNGAIWLLPTQGQPGTPPPVERSLRLRDIPNRKPPESGPPVMPPPHLQGG